MERFCIVVNEDKDSQLEVTRKIVKYLEAKGKECAVTSNCSTCIPGHRTDAAEISTGTDCAIVLGGDGTILQAAYDLNETRIPIFGINMGTLGFLADTELQNLEESLEKLINDEYIIEERIMLRVKYKEHTELALNDVVITRNGFSRVINLGVYINDRYVNDYSGDGIIVATPTGSTAYNLSAGGPVVVPEAHLMLVTPICPHSLYARSIVVSSGDRIVINVNTSKKTQEEEVIATIDGSRIMQLKAEESLEITEAVQTTRLIRLQEQSFFHILNNKLG